jgi:hypothetical protein
VRNLVVNERLKRGRAGTRYTTHELVLFPTSPSFCRSLAADRHKHLQNHNRHSTEGELRKPSQWATRTVKTEVERTTLRLTLSGLSLVCFPPSRTWKTHSTLMTAGISTETPLNSRGRQRYRVNMLIRAVPVLPRARTTTADGSDVSRLRYPHQLPQFTVARALSTMHHAEGISSQNLQLARSRVRAAPTALLVARR